MERRLYEREREDRKIYRSKDLQMSILQLIFSLMLAPKYAPPRMHCVAVCEWHERVCRTH